MRAYYNEIEPYAAEWLRNLIAEGLIAPGDVDERSIEEVAPDELEGYTQCHFFAGTGGWGHALRLAGWPDERPVWTGSVPCQPLSSAGQRRGHADRRHLWPAFFRLIAERRPATLFGEQVASNLGREWLAGVRADLEHVGYACGAADLPAASVGAPHIRQRPWWVADADGRDASAEGIQRSGQHGFQPEDDGSAGGLADAERQRRQPGPANDGRDREGVESRGGEPIQPPLGGEDARGLAEPDGKHGRPGAGRADGPQASNPRGLEYPGGIGSQWRGGEQEGSMCHFSVEGSSFLDCADGKARRVESGTFPLAHGVPNRVGRLRAYGNAIVPQLAAAFIRAYRDVSEVA